VEHRQLGRSGLVISRIAYGNSLTAGEQLDDEEAHACVHAALDAGIDFFDTADVYASGRAEELLGRALRGQRRDGLVVCTKAFFPTGPGANDQGLSRKHLMAAIEGSLHRLDMEYVDIYMAHRFDPLVSLEETMTAFADIVHGGRARYIGVSEWGADAIEVAAQLARELRIPLVCDQVQYSMLWRAVEQDVAESCARHGIGLMAWAPLAGGVLTGKYRPAGEPPDGSRLALVPSQAASMQRWRRLDPEVLARVQELPALAADHGLTPAQLALAWVLHRPGVAGAVVGASRPEQLASNAAVAGVKLDDEVFARIDDVLGDSVVRDPRLIATNG
jgi:aryl-alcohol dehydrogenase-like predicted oxidoreductase